MRQPTIPFHGLHGINCKLTTATLSVLKSQRTRGSRTMSESRKWVAQRRTLCEGLPRTYLTKERNKFRNEFSNNGGGGSKGWFRSERVKTVG